MSDLVPGAAAALLASVLFSVGLVLQSLDAAALPSARQIRPSSFLLLLRARRWVLGGAVMLVGFGFHVAALTLAPLTVVQPALAAGLIVLLLEGARRAGAAITAREWVAVLAIGGGVLGIALTASQRSAADASPALLALILVPLLGLALLPRVLAHRRADDPLALGMPATLGAGAAYSLTGLTTKLASDAVADGAAALATFWFAVTALAALLALIDQTVALQGRDATQVGAVLYVAPVLVPVLIATTLLGEAPSGLGDLVALTLSVLAVCAGAAVLAGSRHVTALETGAEPAGAAAASPAR